MGPPCEERAEQTLPMPMRAEDLSGGFLVLSVALLIGIALRLKKRARGRSTVSTNICMNQCDGVVAGDPVIMGCSSVSNTGMNQCDHVVDPDVPFDLDLSVHRAPTETRM